MRDVNLNQIGYRIQGVAYLNLWGSGQGSIDMQDVDILAPITKEKLLGCINDGGFGCESIDSVELDIFDLFENGYVEFNRGIDYDNAKMIKKFAYTGI